MTKIIKQKFVFKHSSLRAQFLRYEKTQTRNPLIYVPLQQQSSSYKNWQTQKSFVASSEIGQEIAACRILVPRIRCRNDVLC